MRLPLLLILGAVALNAGIYKAKVEPYESYTVAAEAKGRIVALDINDELTTVSKEVLTIDHALESLQLKNLKSKLHAMNRQLAIKSDQNQRIQKVSAKSRFEKEQSELDLWNFKAQVIELKNSIAALEDTLDKKRLRVNNCYLKKLYVRQHEYVVPGSKLLQCEDHTRQRLVLYAEAEEIKAIESKKILIDGSDTHGFEIEKVAASTDETYISAYRIELVGKSARRFGAMLTVEIKE